MTRHKRRKRTARGAEAGGQDSANGAGGPQADRLQKVLAAAGIGSRRDCEELIREGRVEIDRQVVTELGTKVDPLRHEIRVDGEALRRPQRLYYAVNKPMGVVTTNDDPSGRARVIDLVPTEERVFAVGRLDRASEGLILVTNDGEFANRLTHPRYGVEKTYLVRVAGSPTPADLARLTKGVYLSDGFCRVQSIAVKKKQGQSTDLVMVLNEGRNRELRRILARVGHKVLRLKRIAVGPIKLADLPTGAWRRLMPDEIETLLALAREKRKAGKSKRKGQGRTPSDTSQKRSEPVGGEVTGPYLQKQALLAEPLSLDDLLRDDMDEGNLAEGDDIALNSGDVATLKGGVIAYEADEPAARPPRAQPPHDRLPGTRRKQKHGGKRPFRKEGDRQPREQLEQLPRESYGKKRGGKRHFSQKNKGRGAAGETAGNFEFRAKSELQGRKRPAKAGGKPFSKPSGKKYGKPGGDMRRKRFGKPGGKRKGRR